MGARLNWLAVEDADKASLLARLGLEESGTASDEFDSALACAVLPGGWLVLVSTGGELNLDKTLPLASQDGLALGCEVEEHLMFSRLRAFQDGAPTWAVTHDPEVDFQGLAVEGEPPPPFAEVRAALAELQAREHDDVDHMFDAPIRLGQALCGYSHDERPPVAWTILERRGRRRRSATAAAPTPRRIESELTARLMDAFATDLEPMLRASGWVLQDQDFEFREGAWWFHRVVEGRRQVLKLLWWDHGPAINIEAAFAALDGPDANNEAVLEGNTRAVREASEFGSLHLRRRIAALFRPRAAETRRETEPQPVDPFARLMARVKADLAAIEVVLATGEPSARLEVWRPSASG